jgi:rubrerythrin
MGETMGAKFNTEEILEIAVKIEKNGVEFYRKAAELSSNPTITKLFSDLSSWEKTHVDLFNDLLSKYFRADDASNFFDPDAEATKYLEAVADGEIFVVADLEVELKGVTSDYVDVMKKAIQREKDSIIFYSAIMDSLYDTFPKDDLKLVIKEEFSHVRFLSEKLAKL